MSAWIVDSPYGARMARDWDQAFDMLCDAIKETWMRDGRMGWRAAELQTWAEVEHLAPSEPCSVVVFGKVHRIDRAP